MRKLILNQTKSVFLKLYYTIMAVSKKIYMLRELRLLVPLCLYAIFSDKILPSLTRKKRIKR